MPTQVWDEITQLFPNSNGYTIQNWEWIGNFIPFFIIGVIIYVYTRWYYN